MATFDFNDELPRPDGWQESTDGVQTEAPAQVPTGAVDADKALARLEQDCAAPLKSLADLPDPAPEETNPAALFRGGWLRKGGGAFLVSTSGTGKSVFTIQAAACWAMGKPAFGIEPVRPLHVAIIQAEDDDEEMAHFRNEITGGLVEVSGFDRAEIEAAIRRRVMLPQVIGAVGAAFIGEVGALLASHPETDLIIVNPFQSYFGGDVSRNADLSEFLRTGLDPLIKPDRAGVLFVHHTNKPPAAKDREGWGTDAFAAYVGAGGAEIVNWSRAMLAVMPTEAAGVFRLVAGKRGQRLGWVDAAGAKTTKRYIAHSDDRIFWREATPEEAEAVDGGKREKADPAKDAEQLADALRKQAASFTDAREIASQLFTRTRARRAYDAVKDSPVTYRLFTCRAAKKGCMFIGTQPDAEALARAYDAETGGKAESEAVLPT